MPRVAIVLVTFNSARDLDACFGSLATARLGGAEVVAVDNSSTDGTPALVREKFPWVTVVESGSNLGFAGGNDVGIRRALDAGAEWVYLLNPDTDVDPGFLEEALAVGETDPRTAAVQSLLLLHPDRDRVNTAGNAIHFLGFGHCGAYRAERATIAAEPREIAFASGAAVLLRAAALREVGVFDEKLFLYQEDQDLGIRLRLAGWRALLAPRSLVWHHYAFSRNRRKYFYLERNRYIVLAKTLRLRSLLVLAPFLLAADLALLALAGAHGWLPEKLEAYRELLSRPMRDHVRRERARIQASRVVSDRELARWFSSELEFEGLAGGWIPRLLRAPMALVWRVLRPLLG
ncbi:MAG TPA: glycosyltransferase family 2 protein [Anaeromyxobacter sp.]